MGKSNITITIGNDGRTQLLVVIKKISAVSAEQMEPVDTKIEPEDVGKPFYKMVFHMDNGQNHVVRGISERNKERILENIRCK